MNRLTLLTLLALAMIVGACGNKSQQNEMEFINDSTAVAQVGDQMVYGVCAENSAMNTLELITDAGDTLNLDISQARGASQVFGEYAVGDRMAVVLAGDKRHASIVINESELLGSWVQPNPLDGSSYVGFTLKDGGVAESIEQSSLIYRTWRIVSGKLSLIAVREGGGDEEETDMYEFRKLDADSLVLVDGDDLFEFGRPENVVEE